MYVRTTTRKSGKGEVTYVQLAHNEWDPVKKASTTKVLCSFGRADVLDVAGVDDRPSRKLSRRALADVIQPRVEELFEASGMDGCSVFRQLLSIVIPLSGPIIAVISLYCAVGIWNSYFDAFIYLSD